MIKVCPNPIPWNNIFKKLSKFANDHENLSKPPVPLILSGWWATSDQCKKDRWEETVYWAKISGCPEITDALAEENTALKQKVSDLAEELENKGSKIKALETEKDAAEQALQAAESSTESVDTDGEDLASASRQAALLASIKTLLDEINDRVSNFRNNCETVQFCVDDIRDGTDVNDNYDAASELLKDSQTDAEQIKDSVRMFRTEKL